MNRNVDETQRRIPRWPPPRWPRHKGAIAKAFGLDAATLRSLNHDYLGFSRTSEIELDTAVRRPYSVHWTSQCNPGRVYCPCVSS
jgi:hypothetical protein